MNKFIITFFVLMAWTAKAADMDCKSVLLRSVDKITGRTHTMEVKIGDTFALGDLKITPQRCLKKPPEEAPENASFIHVEEEGKDNNTNTVFNGWMFSSNPAISAMDHPIWDIWVLECIDDNPTLDRGVDRVHPQTMAVKPVDVENLTDM